MKKVLIVAVWVLSIFVATCSKFPSSDDLSGTTWEEVDYDRYRKTTLMFVDETTLTSIIYTFDDDKTHNNRWYYKLKDKIFTIRKYHANAGFDNQHYRMELNRHNNELIIYNWYTQPRDVIAPIKFKKIK